MTSSYPCFTLPGILGCTSCRGNSCPHYRHNHSFSHNGSWTEKTPKRNLLNYVWQVSALAGLKLLGVSAGLLLARGASSRSRGTKTHGRRGRRSPKEVSHSHKQNPTLAFKLFFSSDRSSLSYDSYCTTCRSTPICLLESFLWYLWSFWSLLSLGVSCDPSGHLEFKSFY